MRVEPESGAVLTTPPEEVSFFFDEVIAERVAGTPPDIASAVLLSPAPTEVRVGWHRDRITARPREGLQPGRIYRFELLPVVTDLRQNRMRQGLTFVFSTGPPIPSARLQGTIVDWAAGRATPRALIEAVLLPDSLPYRTLTDSAGNFDMREMPSGTYLVYGVMDTNGDRRRGAREAYDTVRVELRDTVIAELYAFVHDTVGPRLRQVEVRDSLTIRLGFDRPLDPAQALDTTNVSLAPAEDSSAHVALAGIFTTRQLDSITTASRPPRDTVRADTGQVRRDTARTTADTTRLPADTSRAVPDTTRARRDTSREWRDTLLARREAARGPAVRAPTRPGPAPGAPIARQAGRPAPLDSTRADKMLARRPPPSDVRFLRLTTPLTPEARYIVLVAGVRGLTGAEGAGRGQLRVPRPRAPSPSPAAGRAPGAPDTLRAAPRDTLRPDTSRRDTTQRMQARPTP